MGHFGYIPNLEKCDMIAGDLYMKIFTYGLAFAIPPFLTTFSCFFIWWYVLSSGKYLKKTG